MMTSGVSWNRQKRMNCIKPYKPPEAEGCKKPCKPLKADEQNNRLKMTQYDMCVGK